MKEQGVVVEVRGAAAIVRLEEQGGCSSCSSAGACKAEAGGRLLEAENRIGAKAGDHVEVELSGGSFITASLVVYMVPVLFLFAGAFLAGRYGPSLYGGISVDAWQALGGVLFLVVSALGLRMYDMLARRGPNRAVISRVL
jgi:sigma-E factor negative regulatory protein RseC